MIPAHVAAWAIERLDREPRLAAMAAREVVRQTRGPGERVIKAEPITIGTAILSVIGITSTSAVVAGAVGAAVLIGASIAVNYAISALTQKPRGTGAIDSGAGISSVESFGGALTPQAMQVVERQPIPRKRIIFGTALVSGPLFFEAVKPPYLYQGLLLCAKRITRFRSMQVGAQQLVFSELKPNAILAPIGRAGQPDYPTRLRASLRLGDVDQAIDPLLAQDFTSLDSGFRQRGTATAVVRYDYGADIDEYTALWGQVARPNPIFLVDGVAVPDPRNPAHILQYNPSDPDETAAAEASWSYSNTAALVQTYYLIQRFGGRILPSRIDWDKVARAADWDEGAIVCADGTSIKRHTIDGVITLNQSPATVLSSMISANRGFVLSSAGRVWPSSSYPRDPVATVYDGILTGGVDYRAAKPKRDLVNRLKVRFVAADREYQQVDGPVLVRSDLRTADGELLDATLDLPFTMDHRRAQRLQKAFLGNARLGRQLTVTCDVVLLADCSDDPIGNPIRFDSVLFAKANGIYLCLDWSFTDNFSSVMLSLVEYDPSIETDYTAATDEQPFVLTDLDLS
ncbi:hypothetical protein [Bradyrhizobium sp. HKCCYLR20261]|uniref:hypothetical protein n=1 Tax=Bradyrhizobium sp. HKCCYLR20261 TaxID=3420760 RepID=UPI003EB7A0F4